MTQSTIAPGLKSRLAYARKNSPIIPLFNFRFIGLFTINYAHKNRAGRTQNGLAAVASPLSVMKTTMANP